MGWSRTVVKVAMVAAMVAPHLAASHSLAGDGAFDLMRLPKGASVTIPRPATTLVPLSQRVLLTATDIPQTISFRPVNKHNGHLTALRLAIYASNVERVQYVDLAPGTPFLYNFKELGSITVITSSAPTDGLQLQVESDKPLEIAH